MRRRSSTSYRKKLIEVALPLEAINVASAREKSIRHGHSSTLHLWWSRKPLATCRAVLFASIVDDPSSRPEEFPTEEAQEQERQRLFVIIERLVLWENTNNEEILNEAREEIIKATDGHPPPVLDTFCGEQLNSPGGAKAGPGSSCQRSESSSSADHQGPHRDSSQVRWNAAGESRSQKEDADDAERGGGVERSRRAGRGCALLWEVNAR